MMTRDRHGSLMALLGGDGVNAVERLDHWVAQHPDDPFFYNGPHERWESFRALGEGSDSIAQLLVERAVDPGESVGLFVSAPFAIARIMLGIWKAGAVFAPINSTLRGALLTYQINDSGARLLFVEAAMADDLRAVLAACPRVERIILVGGGEEEPKDWPVPAERWREEALADRRVRVPTQPHSPALIIYTSGTTGPSKGVVLPQRWIAQYTCLMRAIMTRDDVIYSDLPMYHVGGAIANLVRALWVGCRIACWERFSVSAFWDRVRQCGATQATLLDTMIAWLSNAPPSDRDRLNTLNKVHMQPLPPDHAAVSARFGFDMVSTGFGQTETGGVIHTFIAERAYGEGTPLNLYRGFTQAELAARLASFNLALTPPDAIPARFLGTPSVFLDLCVLDEEDEPCPHGTVGELAVRPRLPHIILKEYLGKPQATATAMRNLWFHTGDAVVQDDEGMYRFIGRMGDRMRVRGENVTAFDVEDVIGRHEGVALCAALGIPASEGDEDDIAVFAIAVEGAALTAEALAAWAEARMPRYMRPRHIRIVPDIPRTPSNKIEKYKLRAALIAELGGGTTDPAPERTSA